MNELAASGACVFGHFRLLPHGGGLQRLGCAGAWQPVELGSRALGVLEILVERHGEIVSRSEIMRAVWPGTIVEEHNLTVQIAALRRVLGPEDSEAARIQTIPGKGYRFVGSVALTEREVALPRLSIVVLPFANLGDDRDADYLADGITWDLTTDLARLPGMFVIARHTAYAYKDRTGDVRAIGRELGVRYAVEGSVQRRDNVLRVNVQLVATDSRTQVWADRFDQALEHLSAGQEEIVRRIGQTLNVAVMDIESARSTRERPTNPDAFDLIIRARSVFMHPMGPLEHTHRLALLEEALRLDPKSVLALTDVAEELTRLTNIAQAGDELKRAADLVAAATEISPRHYKVLEGTAYLLYHDGRTADSLAAYQRLLDEYPNDPVAHNQIGYCLVRLGRPEAAIPMIEAAIRLDPRSAFNYSRFENMSTALLMLGRDEEAIAWSRRALAANRTVYPRLRAQHCIRMAAAHARLGQPVAARGALAEANAMWPYDTVRAHWPDEPTSSASVSQIERYQEALRLAGHRDHADENADFGVPSDDRLHPDLAGPTPLTVPGASTIGTGELRHLLAAHRPVVILSSVRTHLIERNLIARAVAGASWCAGFVRSHRQQARRRPPNPIYQGRLRESLPRRQRAK